jgi:hypothetical protein
MVIFALLLVAYPSLGSGLKAQSVRGSALVVPRRAVLPALAGAACLSGLSLPADARSGDYAKTAMPTQPESTLGGAAQETGSRQVWDLEVSQLAGEALAKKKLAIAADWSDMASKVDRQLKKKQYVDLQSTLALRMTKLKSNMRDVARAQNGGDLIAYEAGSKDQPKFDYSLGKYELTEQAKLTEEVVVQINYAYIAAGRRDAEGARQAWESALTAFDAWSKDLM